MRRKQAEKRIPVPDPIYGDVTVAKFISAIMRDGKRSLAQKIVYGAFDTVEERTGEPGVEIFRKAINNIAPLVEVRSRRVGGATYQVPIEVRPERRTSLAFRWLIQFARAAKRATLRCADRHDPLPQRFLKTDWHAAVFQKRPRNRGLHLDEEEH